MSWCSRVVAEEFLAAADREIDEVVAADPPSADTTGKHFYFLGPERLPAADRTLRQSGALALAEELTAPDRLVHGYGHMQIALNIPPWEHVPGGPHLDGHHDPERPDPFALLVGVFLGDESDPGSGNLWVWPGSHLAHAELFRTEGVMALNATSGHSTLLDPPLDLGSPIPIRAGRGDLLLAHYLLGHNTGGNTTTRTRRALYYRLSTADQADRWVEALTDPFHHVPTLKPTEKPT